MEGEASRGLADKGEDEGVVEQVAARARVQRPDAYTREEGGGREGRLTEEEGGGRGEEEDRGGRREDRGKRKEEVGGGRRGGGGGGESLSLDHPMLTFDPCYVD